MPTVASEIGLLSVATKIMFYGFASFLAVFKMELEWMHGEIVFLVKKYYHLRVHLIFFSIVSRLCELGLFSFLTRILVAAIHLYYSGVHSVTVLCSQEDTVALGYWFPS